MTIKMTIIRSCCFALFLAIILLQLVVGMDDPDAAFPRVYSALIPDPSSRSVLNMTDTDDAFHLTAHVDVLGVWERGIALIDANVDSAKFMRIGFLVHSASELKRLERLVSRSTASNPYAVQDMMWDKDETRRMQDRARYVGDEHYRRLQEQPFDTIEGFECYKNLKGSLDWMGAMVERTTTIANLTAEKIDIGSSYLRTVDMFDGYSIYALKLTGTGAGLVDKGIMMTLSGLHAREYTPPELVSRWIEKQVSGYGVDASITSLLDQTEIYAILQGNPDGRFIAETQRDEYRRKNLNPVGNCDDGDLGVDLNRNFPFEWGLDTGSSDDPCSEVYRGESAASEPEVQAIIEFARAVFPEEQRKEAFHEAYPDTVKGVFMDIHAFGEVVLWPWDYANLPTPNEAQFQAIASKIQFLNDYDLAGPGENFFGAASGSTGDFGYTALGAASLALELGTDFYESCEYFLDTILPANMKVLTYAASISRAPFRLSQGPDILDVSVSLERVSEGVVLIRATASDSEMSTGTGAMVQQSIDFIEVFVDEHPDARIDGEPPVGLQVPVSFSTSPTTGSILHLLEIDSLSRGRHAVYVRATDVDGFEGPVSAVWLDKVDSGNTRVPSQAPVPPDCEDDANTTFTVSPFLPPIDCEWLAANSAFQRRYCRKGSVAYLGCPTTCGNCPGADQGPRPSPPDNTIRPVRQVGPSTVDAFDGPCVESTDPFQAFGIETRDCEWLRIQPRWQRIMCRASHPAWEACPEVCGRCSG